MLNEVSLDPSTSQLRTESTLVRPFESMNFLEEAGIKILDDEIEFRFEQRIEIEDIDRSSVRPVLLLPPIPENFFEEVGATESELSLFVWVTDTGLKRSAYLLRQTVADWPSGELKLDPARTRSVSWADGTYVGVAVVLSENRPIIPGQADRAGQWLAQKTFTVTRPHAKGDSLIKYLSEESFVNEGLPARTTYFIDVKDPSDLNEPLTDPPQLQILFSEKLAAAIAQRPTTMASKALLAQFHAELIVHVITMGVGALEPGDQVQPGSVLDGFIKLAARELTLSELDVMRLGAENQGTGLRPHLQDRLQVTQLGISSVRGI